MLAPHCVVQVGLTRVRASTSCWASGTTQGNAPQLTPASNILTARDRPYDPYVPSPSGSQPGSAGRQPGSAGQQPGSAGGGGGGAGNARTAAIQAEIDNTVNIMQENIKKVAQRGERLDTLQDKTGGSLWPEQESSDEGQAADGG